MKKGFILIILLRLTLLSFAQSDTLSIDEIVITQKKEIEELTSIIDKQQKSIQKLENSIVGLRDNLDGLDKSVINNKNSLISIVNGLEIKIKETNQNANTQISHLDDNVKKNIIMTLVIFLFGVSMYLFLRRHIKSSQADVEEQIKNTKKTLEEEGLKLDNKLIEVLETQLKLSREKKQISTQAQSVKMEADHSLVLKVADEIVRMQKNISKIDDNTKGLKPLIKGIERIQNNFSSNGYEIINLLNNEYDERMNIDVINFITDENLSTGKKIISAVIKPQVNYNGVLIQRAQVDVSQNKLYK
jgi:hypothetical protein